MVLIIVITVLIVSIVLVNVAAGCAVPAFFKNQAYYTPAWIVVYGLLSISWILLLKARYNAVLLGVLFGLSLLFALLWIIAFFYLCNTDASVALVSLAIIVNMILIVISPPLVMLLLTIHMVWLLFMFYVNLVKID
jgi:hypothetical protein